MSVSLQLLHYISTVRLFASPASFERCRDGKWSDTLFVQNKTRIGNLDSFTTYSSAGVDRSFLRKPETRFSLMRRTRLAAVGRVGLRGISTC